MIIGNTFENKKYLELHTRKYFSFVGRIALIETNC